MKIDEIILAYDKNSMPILSVFKSSALGGRRAHKEHHHTQLEISAVLSGSCCWNVRSQSVFCKKGDIMVFGSDEEHYITEIDKHSPFLLLNLQFEPRYIWSFGSDPINSRYLGIFLNHDQRFQNLLPADNPAASTIFSLMEQIFAEGSEKKPEYELIVKAKLMLLLGILGREHHDCLGAKNVPDQRLIYLENAMSYINENLCEKLSLGEIAQHAGMSRSSFSDLFKKMNGISVWDYVTGKRIELAMKYLQETSKNILEISGLCGYNSLASFNRNFRLITHCTPREYRDMMHSSKHLQTQYQSDR